MSIPAAPTDGDDDRQELQRSIARSDLRSFENTEAARRLAILEADAALMLRLSVEGFDGTAWRTVSDALIEYGWQVFRAWVPSGMVFAKLREKGQPCAPPPPNGFPEEDARDLAEDTVALGIVGYRDKSLKTGKWNPAKGANLTTYFIGYCLMFVFPNLYRSWLKQHLRTQKHVGVSATDAIGDEHSGVVLASPDDPARWVIAADTTERALATILEPIDDPVNRTIVQLRAEGYGIDEIAEAVQLTYKQVESRIYRVRQKLGRTPGVAP